ncbi:hypothetical protein AMECASPLE_002406 [Ameca splendens]|uniref:Secreted protein n=1 Tax=Ameca splendens TaxID=208324 RepID=A0ABV0XYN6_9TELE
MGSTLGASLFICMYVCLKACINTQFHRALQYLCLPELPRSLLDISHIPFFLPSSLSIFSTPGSLDVLLHTSLCSHDLLSSHETLPFKTRSTLKLLHKVLH